MSKQTKLQTKKITSANASASTSHREILLADDLQQCQTQAPEDVEALILKVSESFGATMEEKLSKFSETLDKISTTLDDLSMRITAAEQRVSDVEDEVTGLGKRLAEAEKKIVLLVSCVDDLENRSRRDNIRIINLKEGTEGTNPIQFFETWLPSFLGLDKRPSAVTRIKMDRAHRSFWSLQGARPRPVVIKLHNSRDKQRIMAAVKAAPVLEHDGQRITINQDLSSAVREKRRAFNAVCRVLIDKGIRFNMHFPATLTLTHQGATHKFSSPKEAEAFVQALV
ncbi:hypothetical protein WMY93_027085 [Mugilogobius chulae]|uniref:L1 transposable element RRM domain-containing protein n=1 Tax=Mugilogobius chulae TaxID=88201 RepID=A0AAW0N3P7_9GOBI